MFRDLVFCFCWLVVGTTWVSAQEDSIDISSSKPRCSYTVFHGEVSALFHWSGNSLDNQRREFDIQWQHHTSSGLDTFVIRNSLPTETWIFATSRSYKELRIPERNILRAIADHHLRERVFQTALRLDDLELLAHGNFFCLDSNAKQANRLLTSQSSMWYTIEWQVNKAKEYQVTFSGIHKSKRMLSTNAWPLQDPQRLPADFDLTEGTKLQAKLSLLHWNFINDTPSRSKIDSLFWHPWVFRVH